MKRNARLGVLVTAASFALLITACTGRASAPPPTRTPAPTFTPTPLVQPAAPDPNAVATAQALQAQQPAAPAAPVDPGAQQPAGQTDQGQQPLSTSVFSETAQTAPPAEAAPTDTPAPVNASLTVAEMVNVRGGPGTTYNIVGAANPGQTFPITGKSPDGQWWQVDFNGQAGWVFAQLVTAQNTDAVAVAQNIPVAPTAAPAPPPEPTATPAPVAEAPPPAEPEPAPAPANDNYPYGLLSTERCDPNPGITYFEGYTRDANNNPINAVCILLYFYEPRTIKCSGCDGVGDGNWGFSPFGGKPAPSGTQVEIYVVECPPNGVPKSGQNEGFGNLTPQSPKWTRTINESEQCTGITFYRK